MFTEECSNSSNSGSFGPYHIHIVTFNYSNRTYATLIEHTLVDKNSNRTVTNTVWIIEGSDNRSSDNQSLDNDCPNLQCL